MPEIGANLGAKLLASANRIDDSPGIRKNARLSRHSAIRSSSDCGLCCRREDYPTVGQCTFHFYDPDGYPALEPPWGTLNAINLNTGAIIWKIPFGEFPELVAKGIHDTGSENYGGPVVTAGGLIFIGTTSFDRKFRAFDKATGKILWETILPAAGNATPAVYESGGREYVVIAAGGGKNGGPPGGSYVAFALPAGAVGGR